MPQIPTIEISVIFLVPIAIIVLGACLACYHRGLTGPGSEPLESDARVVKHD